MVKSISDYWVTLKWNGQKQGRITEKKRKKHKCTDWDQVQLLKAITPCNCTISFTNFFYNFNFLHLFNIFLSNGWDVTFNLHPSMLLHQVQYPSYCTWSQSAIIEQQTLLMEETMEAYVCPLWEMNITSTDNMDVCLARQDSHWCTW